jgi:hypothetical protein
MTEKVQPPEIQPCTCGYDLEPEVEQVDSIDPFSRKKERGKLVWQYVCDHCGRCERNIEKDDARRSWNFARLRERRQMKAYEDRHSLLLTHGYPASNAWEFLNGGLR